MKKEDMRTRRTKKALKKALTELMIIDSIEKISVTDICAKAEINRVTFYTHYTDKYELLNELLSDICGLIDRENQIYYQKNKTGDLIADYTRMISHSIYKICFQNKELINSLNSNADPIFTKMVEDIIIKEGMKTINLLKDKLDIYYPNRFIVEFLIGGFKQLVFEYALKEQSLTEKEFFMYFDKLLYSLLKSEIFFKIK
jgi:AcrR family transcriptional regulator